MLTFSQIEEVRRGEEPSLSLARAAANVGIGFKQCPECKGNGWTRATLLVSMREIEILAKECSAGEVPIQYDRCDRCRGVGGWILGA